MALSVGRKLVLGWGDHALTLTLSALSVLYFEFLVEFVGLRPALAGAVPLIGRAVDAFTDPLMGRISDMTRTRWGRRRPYLVAGSLPFSLSFVLIWLDPGFSSEWATFSFCVVTYLFYSLASTVVSVPYVALIPEIVPDYDERTSVSAYRSAFAVLGTMVALVGMLPIVEALGGGVPGYVRTSALLAVWCALPWMAIVAITRENPRLTPVAPESFFRALRTLATHATYRRLTGLYLLGRVAMDLVGAIFLIFFTVWLHQRDTFPLVMAVFFGTAVLALPLWVWLAERWDKHRVFLVGAVWWGGSQTVLIFADTSWTVEYLIAFALVAAIGYGVVDMMPWSMLGEVIDEDEHDHGERRDGLYGGSFTFLRKLAGASAVFLAGAALDIAGYRGSSEAVPETALTTLRWMTAFGPACLLFAAAVVAWSYPLDRERHAEIRRALESRRGVAGDGLRPRPSASRSTR